MSYNVAVIGGGPAGLLAAIAASEHGASVTLLERNNELGTELLMSENDGCSITNAGSIEHLTQSFPASGQFLRTAFQVFSNRDILDLLAEEGVLTREEDGGRVFPISDSASDVLEALERRARSRGVNIRLKTLVTGMSRKEGAVGPGWAGFTLHLESGELLHPDRVILCTGGQGSGYVWARQFGHSIVPPRSAIVALETEEEWPGRVPGVALRGVEVVVRAAETVIARYKEDVVFTNLGVSGPAILNISQQALQAQESNLQDVVLGIRTDPELRADDWEARLQMALREHPRQLLKSLVARWWPVSLAEVLLEVHGIPPEVMANQVTKVHRHQTAELLDEFRLHLKKARPVEAAMATAGGVDLLEVDPSTMESLRTEGLFIAGEMLDVDGVNTGYNLQAAYSTGYVAGLAAAADPAV